MLGKLFLRDPDRGKVKEIKEEARNDMKYIIKTSLTKGVKSFATWSLLSAVPLAAYYSYREKPDLVLFNDNKTRYVLEKTLRHSLKIGVNNGIVSFSFNLIDLSLQKMGRDDIYNKVIAGCVSNAIVNIPNPKEMAIECVKNGAMEGAIALFQNGL